MGRLTEPHLQSLLRKGQPVAGKSDGDGLVFTISKSGAAIWKLRYRFAGRPRWMTLGSYSDISLKEARLRALKERAKIADHVDVVAERRRAKLALMNAKTFAELAEDFMLRTGAALKPDTRLEIRRYLDKDLLPRLGQLRIEEITGAEVVYVVEQIAKRSAYVAHRAFEILSQIFKHGLAKRLAKVNPCGGLSPSAIVGKKQRVRELVSLSEAELRELFLKLPAIGQAASPAI